MTTNPTPRKAWFLLFSEDCSGFSHGGQKCDGRTTELEVVEAHLNKNNTPEARGWGIHYRVTAIRDTDMLESIVDIVSCHAFLAGLHT